MKFVYVLPIGNPDGKLLHDMATAIGETFRVPVEVREYQVELGRFYDPERGQYHSTRILQHLKEHPPHARHLPAHVGPDDITLLAVLPHDLFIPILTFVFGEAELSGTTAVVSYHRLQNERYGLARDRALLARRLRKEALHELGHTAGLLHCPSQLCVMRSSTNVEEIDLKGEHFCRECGEDLERRA